MPTLNMIGCGHVGKTLGRLWHASGSFALQDVLTRSPQSAAQAVRFIGAGRPLNGLAGLRSADLWLIATPDDAIETACEALAKTGLLGPDQVVFHCSGALPSSVLRAAAGCGAAVASVHPIKSFADPGFAAEHFAGTWCGIEGDAAALALLDPACRAIGAHPVPIDPEFKSVYHGAAVFASNYLVTVLDLALQAYEKAGVPRETAQQLIEPLVRGTVENVFSVGTTAALSGPIARGDMATALKQYRALSAWNPRIGRVYKALAKPTAAIARRRRGGREGRRRD
jgi:predicted short-subunit dehydrogenase-like oxidoreductase (DUF2520 family)